MTTARRLCLRAALLALAMLWPAVAAWAQTAPGDPAPPAMLVADRVFVTADRKLIAEGNVEAFQGDTRIRASRITFDQSGGKLQIEGPIRIDHGDRSIVLADAAEMDRDLQNGLLTGARMVLDQQVQMAALQMTRVGGRYTQLYKTAVTSCHVCADGRPPLWQIRARKVTHDQFERQLYFEGAQLRVLDVPVFYLPAMRLPDPSLDRANGFLIPSFRSTTQLGTGVLIPYFFRLGDHRDLTLTPYLSPRTRTLNYRYRQAFRRGALKIEGAHTNDDLIPDEDRGYLFAEGLFDLGRGYRLDFDIKTVSDDAYLVDYGLPNYDRLRSDLAVSRYRRDTAFRVGLTGYKTLRDTEDDATQPTRVIDAGFERRFFPTGIGGEVRLGLVAHAHERTSTVDIIGRDVGRATADLEWRRNWLMGGLRADGLIGFSADTFNISDDSLYPDRINRMTPRAAISLRYPMTRVGAGGAVHYLEPVMQLGWTNTNGGIPPDDESRFVEFDRGNLLSLSRFPAPDRREDGVTFVYGLNWARFAPSGWEASATVGQVFRTQADPNFTLTSGLSGTSSDMLLAGQLRTDNGLSLTARGLLSGSLDFSKAELRGDWDHRRFDLSGSYLWLRQDLREGRPQPVSELWFDGAYEFNPNWTAGAILRYDLTGNQAIGAGIGLIYSNECVTVDLSLNRRYTSTTSVEPSTDFGFTIALNGFSVAGGTENYRRSCKS
jgi:LPS-assembly protein